VRLFGFLGAREDGWAEQIGQEIWAAIAVSVGGYCLGLSEIAGSGLRSGGIVRPWLNRCRRLAKDFEKLTRNAPAFSKLASTPTDAQKTEQFQMIVFGRTLSSAFRNSIGLAITS
jgi:hypothetical protein